MLETETTVYIDAGAPKERKNAALGASRGLSARRQNQPRRGERRRGMNHEEELIKAFFQPTKRERYLEMVTKPKKRRKFLLELAHFKALDPRFCFAVPKGVHGPEEIAAFLSQKGAPRSCRVTSEAKELDSKEMLLVYALKRVVGYQMGTFLSCLPGTLAYFEDEDGRWILEHRV